MKKKNQKKSQRRLSRWIDFGLWDEEENETELIFPYEAVGSPYPPPLVSPNFEPKMDITRDHAWRVSQKVTCVENIKEGSRLRDGMRRRFEREPLRRRFELVAEERPSEAIDVLAVCREPQPLKPHGPLDGSQIMPPKTLEQKAVKRTMQKQVAEAIAEYEKNRTNLKNDRGSKGNVGDAGGVITPPVHGCSYKTFLNCKPHSLNGTEGVVGLKRWFEKMEHVFKISKFAEEDKVKFVDVLLKVEL
ncbi:hypothetical protein Tco_1036065 [Tanacetum coccineum]